ncbi:B3 domain-containing protein REM5-like isoform X2 [Malania oleifera]|uniref:B3 domain-containing protein REM5-like isoform X2 n=1 Tax=Malania oleifera TaxID=397392 RepID=UPI0025AE4B4F|nr:B3 domain-containing protein REM5-like isoform X2 [Malania oleifera]
MFKNPFNQSSLLYAYSSWFPPRTVDSIFFHDQILLDGTHGEHCKQAVLRSSSTRKHWPVKMNGRRLEDGWPEFARDHDLHVGDFLVFRHEGNFLFHITVFDPTACERKYPPSYHHHVKLEDDDDQSQENDHSFKLGPVKDFRGSKDVLRKKPEHPCFWRTVPFHKDPRLMVQDDPSRREGKIMASEFKAEKKYRPCLYLSRLACLPSWERPEEWRHPDV